MNFKDAAEIKEAVGNGQLVFWKNPAYQIIKSKGNYLVHCKITDHYWGLTTYNGKLNGELKDFYIAE